VKRRAPCELWLERARGLRRTVSFYNELRSFFIVQVWYQFLAGIHPCPRKLLANGLSISDETVRCSGARG